MKVELNIDGKQDVFEKANTFFGVVDTDKGSAVKIEGMSSLSKGIYSVANLFVALLEVFDEDDNIEIDDISFGILRFAVQKIRTRRGKGTSNGNSVEHDER